MQNYNPKNWHFLNMNSPADLYAEYGNGTVRLSEYDGCRDGHALLSDFAVDKIMYFSTQIKDIGQGAAIGLYYGDGCFSDYLLVAACNGRISVRIPSGVPQGDTFRMQGARRYYEIISQEYKTEQLTELAFAVVEGKLSVSANGKTLINALKVQLPYEVKKPPKIILKALNETKQQRKTEVLFGRYNVKGIAKEVAFPLQCMEADGKTPWSGGSLHIAGEYERWTRTDNQGEACFDGLPFGTYRIVTGREEEEFLSFEVEHDGGKKVIIRASNPVNLRENRPQENLVTDASYIGLNGIWNFDIDKTDKGEKEKWFLQGNHAFLKCIKVPFSWQSLLAAGEEELADEYTLHHANTFLCTAKEVGEIGWYQRRIRTDWDGETELVFAAVSGVGKVWLGDKLIGCLTDSYNRRTFRLGKLEKGKNYFLTVKVEYEHGNNTRCSGKQGFWFTDAPGIWQNVWLRERQNERIDEVLVDYRINEKEEAVIEIVAEIDIYGRKVNIDRRENKFLMKADKDAVYRLNVTYVSSLQGRIFVKINDENTVHCVETDAVSGEGIFDTLAIYFPLSKGINEIECIPNKEECSILQITAEEINMDKKAAFQWEKDEWFLSEMQWDEKKKKITAGFSRTLQNVRKWSCTNPFLYTLKTSVIEEDKASGMRTAIVQRYVGIREIGVSPYSEELGTYITVNKEKTYIRGVLDQGYNPWGIYTYPALEGEKQGSLAFDIKAAKECGYNLMRMHIKDNEPDWYRICDETGMLVWDEIPCNFYGTANNEHWQSMYRRQLKAAVIKHNYHPSIILCSTINESWGISGDHEKSPWEDVKGQELIKEYAKYYKSSHPYALAVDNSGYAKTSEAQVLDYHSYPGNFKDAHNFFAELERMNYPGSVFNCYSKEHKALMKKARTRDLLQRTCAQDLNRMNYIGEECQLGQPVLLSEFVHTDRQEELIRIFKGFAGYVRMNLASAENEDTSPYTAKRTKRDFGYADSDFSTLGYRAVNEEDFLFLDMPFLTKVNAQDNFSVPVYLSLWSDACKEGEEVEIRFCWKLMSERGIECELPLSDSLFGKILKYTPFLFGQKNIKIPSGFLGGYLFAEAYTKEKKRIGVTSIQFEIFPKENETADKDDSRTEWKTTEYAAIDGFLYKDNLLTKKRNLLWAFGNGKITYRILRLNHKIGKLILEVSACDLLEGTKITDDNARDAEIEIFINGCNIGQMGIKELSTDRKALFSNSSAEEKSIVDDSKTGCYGYGRRIEIPIVLNDDSEEELILEIAAGQRGIVLYGERMGRYGCNPYICWET